MVAIGVYPDDCLAGMIFTVSSEVSIACKDLLIWQATMHPRDRLAVGLNSQFPLLISRWTVYLLPTDRRAPWFSLMVRCSSQERKEACVLCMIGKLHCFIPLVSLLLQNGKTWMFNISAYTPWVLF